MVLVAPPLPISARRRAAWRVAGLTGLAVLVALAGVLVVRFGWESFTSRPRLVVVTATGLVPLLLLKRAWRVRGQTAELARPGIYLDAVPSIEVNRVRTATLLSRGARDQRHHIVMLYLPSDTGAAAPLAKLAISRAQHRSLAARQTIAVHGWGANCVIATDDGVIWPLSAQTKQRPVVGHDVAMTTA
jgi:hypothetical protein